MIRYTLKCATGHGFDSWFQSAAALDKLLTVGQVTCPVCGADLSHQRADDGPAYLTILVVGHIMAPLIYFVYSTWRPEPPTLAAIFCTFTVALSLILLPRLKGAFVALQWSQHMHGFGSGEPDLS